MSKTNLFRLAFLLALLPAIGFSRAARPQTTPPNTLLPTQSLGAFITPVDARASSSQEGAGRTPNKLIDGSGWGETKPGSGVYVHTNNVGADGNCMWNGDANSPGCCSIWAGRMASTAFTCGTTTRCGGWNTRGVREVEISASSDNKTFQPVGTYTLRMASGQEDERGRSGRVRQNR